MEQACLFSFSGISEWLSSSATWTHKASSPLQLPKSYKTFTSSFLTLHLPRHHTSLLDQFFQLHTTNSPLQLPEPPSPSVLSPLLLHQSSRPLPGWGTLALLKRSWKSSPSPSFPRSSKNSTGSHQRVSIDSMKQLNKVYVYNQNVAQMIFVQSFQFHLTMLDWEDTKPTALQRLQLARDILTQPTKGETTPSQVNWPRTNDFVTCFVTDFVAVISSQSEGLGKMALGIVKIYLGLPFSANRRCSRSVCSQSVGSRSVVVDPNNPSRESWRLRHLNAKALNFCALLVLFYFSQLCFFSQNT